MVLAHGGGVVVLGLQGGAELDAGLEERAGFADRLERAVELGWAGAVAVAEESVVLASELGHQVALLNLQANASKRGRATQGVVDFSPIEPAWLREVVIAQLDAGLLGPGGRAGSTTAADLLADAPDDLPDPG